MRHGSWMTLLSRDHALFARVAWHIAHGMTDRVITGRGLRGLGSLAPEPRCMHGL